MSHTGEIAALLAALAWTISAVCWTVAGARAGSLVVGAIRMFLALPLFLIYGHFVLGEAVPLSIPTAAWLWLGLSGVVGFFLCDICLFRALLEIGPRLTLLIFSLSPLATLLFGWLALDERLSAVHITGMLIALSGVIWVVLESPGPHSGSGRPYRFSWRGGCLATMAMLMQSAATVIAKLGLRNVQSAVAATEIRVIAGVVCFAALMLVLRRYPRFVPVLTNVRTMAVITIGTIAGPCVGVGLLMFSLQRISAGLAATFISLIPVMVIPFTIVLFKERVTMRALMGAVVAFSGLALLFLN